MFPKCEDAKWYGCGRTKTTAIVGKMAAHSGNTMAEALKRRAFAIAVDGSNDSGSQMYPIVATYYVEESRNVESRLLCLQELHGEATGRKIGNLVLDALKSRGAACLPAKFDEVLEDIFYYFEKSAKRKDRLVEFQGMHNTEVRKILKHVPTQWLSLGRCLTRLLKQWQPLVSFFLNETKPKSQQRPSFLGSYQIPKTAAASADVRDEVQRDHQKRKEPRDKIDATQAKKVKLSSESSGRASLTLDEWLLYFLTSDVNFAYGLFLKSVIPVFDKVNAQLQSQAPQIHLLQSLLMQFLRDLLARFVNPSAMKACSSPLEVPYQDLKNQKANEDLVLGSHIVCCGRTACQ
ncbi:hypothetical protein HPB51_008003 [Rhipicephalus microplus]|uniref:Uncharacterized protein n=1 Tax=Rhipicephalus microplus TaxID=6941 RepID=A0A9J6DFX3_RHIMP|nr:hypothetical protein HPB51_008003 [Rhipicephalus microplus]